MAGGSAVARRELLAELARLREAESSFDGELQQIFSNITNKKLEGGAQGGVVAGSKKPSGSAAFDATDLSNNVRRVEQFAPCYEAMVQDSKKLVVQVEDCRALSDRLSVMVRRLDLKQSRAQQALSCTDDIISLKECKVKLQSAIDDGNLPLAVGCIRQVHAIDKQISSSCDDYAAILSAEQTVKSLVQSEFSTAIQASDLDKVVALCPLLQTLGLEAEARDSFLDFIEATVFIGVSADASAVDDATDPATGYAQALSNIFNSTYVILQQYLPMVIQGLDRSLGDVHFIKRLHAKCEAEAGLVLKRYMKFRGVQAMITAIKSSGSSSSGSSSGSGSGIGGIGGMGAGSKTGPVASADLHAMLDELALLIQYCCLYSRYLKQLCAGAESRTRGAALPSHSTSPAPDAASASASASASAIAPPSSDSPSPSPSSSPSPQSVFGGPAEFDRMVDELVNRYYMEGERALMQAAARSAFPRSAGTGAGSGSGAGSGAGAGSGSGAGSGAGGEGASAGLDECFFVLQRCGQRAVATNNIHAACAVLHSLSDLLAGQVLTRAQEALAAAVARAAAGVAEHVGRLVGSAGGGGGGAGGGGADATALAKGLKSAMSLASSIAASGTGATTSTGPGSGSSSSSGSASNASSSNASGGLGGGNDEDEDRWGLARPLEVFNAVERCARYTDRLARDVGAAGATVFSSASSGSGSGSGSSSSSSSSSSGGKKGGTGAGAGAGGSSELDKLRLCREDFDAAKLAFTQALRSAAEKFAAQAQAPMKDILACALGRASASGAASASASTGSGSGLGGVRFELPDAQFDQQAAASLLPRSLAQPFEALLDMSTSALSDGNRDLFVGLLAEACCERLEHFVTQQRGFSFAGALKMDECVRAVSGVFARCGSGGSGGGMGLGAPVRGKFSRLREIMQVLTLDGGGSAAALGESASLTHGEVQAFLGLRVDAS